MGCRVNDCSIGRNLPKNQRGFKFSDEQMLQDYKSAQKVFWNKMSSELSGLPDRSSVSNWEQVYQISNKLLDNLADHHPESALDSIQGAFYALNARVAEHLAKADLHVFKDALGMVIQDIGKQFVPKAILNQSSVLDLAQRQAIGEHVKKGHNLLVEQGNGFMVFEIGPAILEHHQHWENGLGKQSEYGSVVRIFDVFGSMTSPYRYYGTRKTVLEALTEIENGGEEKFNQVAVQILKRKKHGLVNSCPSDLIPPVYSQGTN